MGRMKYIVGVLVLISLIHGGSCQFDNMRKHYIVYMGKHSLPDQEAVVSSNHDLLASVFDNAYEARQAVVYHYHWSFRGFSAMLTPDQADLIAKSESVISVFESKLYQLQTTRSWKFLNATGDSSVFKHASTDEDHDVIIGHLDTGVWPESPSFSDEGLGPVPERFKGICQTGEGFPASKCNKKLIGARYYYQGFEQEVGLLESLDSSICRSPRDCMGHGSHTASTAAGAPVEFDFGPNQGGMQTVRGGAPNARLAIYKVCWSSGCSSADVLKAFDDAVHDKVDIITISAGGQPGPPFNYLHAGLSIGAFHAFAHGILTSASAGNYGQSGSSNVDNAAPWILTVAASSIDRDFVSNMLLGNGKTLQGYGMNNNELKGDYLIYPAQFAARRGVSTRAASACMKRTLSRRLVRGKIIVCTRSSRVDDIRAKAAVVAAAGGAGMIVMDQYSRSLNEVSPTSIPTVVIDRDESKTLIEYVNSPGIPVGNISATTVKFDAKPAPRMSSFSSKGPNSVAPYIIKPDITAPGENIIAAVPPATGEADTPQFGFNSGTSMSCPHAAAVAAVVKGVHPDWSPAEIKSALMTTASQVDNSDQPIQSMTGVATPFDMGSGHINPNAALNPGLVYDMSEHDVLLYLCSAGVPKSTLQMLFGIDTNCPDPPVRGYHLNYPSIGISRLTGKVSVSRTVTYRGKSEDPKVFKLRVEEPQGVKINVSPEVLDFSGGQKSLNYTVNVTVERPYGRYVFGSLTWFNDVHSVRSPIAVQAL